MLGLCCAATLALLTSIAAARDNVGGRWLGVAAAAIVGLLFFSGVLNRTLELIGFRIAWKANRPAPGSLAQLDSRTALVMPIYNEDTEGVQRGVRQTWRSCKRAGLDKHCDFFLLSDSTDPGICREEEKMFKRLVGEFSEDCENAGRLFLIRRSDRRNFKGGNIMNFLERHGDDYDFMLVLDADSVMLGPTILGLILRMQREPKTGLIQSLMVPLGAITPFARAMQYATSRSLPVMTAGMYWFWDSESIYWGHNALIRIAPFREHCKLPTLPGKPPLGGTILSQDIVEASFLGRAGWNVEWEVDCGGSFDELPANIITYGQRDRRWCQGNFQHFHLLFAPGITFGHRLNFAYGIFAYVASPLMLLALSLGFVRAILVGPSQASSAVLWSFVIMLSLMLILPRTLALARVFIQWRRWVVPEKREFKTLAGRVATELLSMNLELTISVLTAPSLFYLHTRFILEILTGKVVSWKSQSRDPRGRLSWRDAAKVFWVPTLVGALWLLWAVLAARSQISVVAPISVGWILSIPIAVWTSNPELGEFLIRRGLFPELLAQWEAEELTSQSRIDLDV